MVITVAGYDSAVQNNPRAWLFGVLLSTAEYGVVATLFCACVFLLRKSSGDTRNNTHFFLLWYITMMFTLSTAGLLASIIKVTKVIFQHDGTAVHQAVMENTTTSCVILANWGADGFLLWRCAVFYHGVCPLLRWVILVLVSFLASISLAMGVICFLINSNTNILSGLDFDVIFVAFACSSAFINLVITGLIVGRIIYFRRSLAKTLGHNSSLSYTSVISMLVESASLVVIFVTAYVICALAPGLGNISIVPLESLTNIYVISPLIIIFRVGQGKSWQRGTAQLYLRDIETSQPRQAISALHFADSPSVISFQSGQSVRDHEHPPEMKTINIDENALGPLPNAMNIY
ncbi:hypothetical protein B0H34DRAFT_346155 [Crassisporium funariophilum]|nr:hypothetical protein B0H34DRAFT_346155 [Crassisporium funariophilum]